jgi:hypothetical protein
MVAAGAKKCGLSTSTEFWALLETERTVHDKNKHESTRRERNFYLLDAAFTRQVEAPRSLLYRCSQKTGGCSKLAKTSGGLVCAVHPFTKAEL